MGCIPLMESDVAATVPLPVHECTLQCGQLINPPAEDSSRPNMYSFRATYMLIISPPVLYLSSSDYHLSNGGPQARVVRRVQTPKAAQLLIP